MTSIQTGGSNAELFLVAAGWCKSTEDNKSLEQVGHLPLPSKLHSKDFERCGHDINFCLPFHQTQITKCTDGLRVCDPNFGVPISMFPSDIPDQYTVFGSNNKSKAIIGYMKVR